ncbi:hypothetical protein GOP47_0027845 [Adiantum capillus-veneris]|nr:hypothetical protein GOP47_0027845 [Adiantum capillus-veneris]
MEENRDLKAYLRKLEARFDSMVNVVTDKAKEVEAKVTQAHSAVIKKVQTCVTMELGEQRVQEENSFKVQIGGLPSSWCTTNDTLREAIIKLNNILQTINIKPKAISWINDTNRQVPFKHCLLTLKEKEEQVRLLRQSHLLKGTKVWIVEELTMNQLKMKKQELKKVYEAQKQGKWAVYRGGKAIIQKFQTPKGTIPLPDPT